MENILDLFGVSSDVRDILNAKCWNKLIKEMPSASHSAVLRIQSKCSLFPANDYTKETA